MTYFLALALPSGAVNNTVRSASQLAQHITMGTVSGTDSYMIPLQYLGQLSSDRLMYVYSIMDSVSSSNSALTLAYTSIANWRSTVVAKVKLTKQLIELHSCLADRLEQLGIAVERRAYRPHVTLATNTRFGLPFGEVSKCVDVYNMPFVCSSMVLYQRIYTEDKVTFTPIHTVQLPDQQQ